MLARTPLVIAKPAPDRPQALEESQLVVKDDRRRGRDPLLQIAERVPSVPTIVRASLYADLKRLDGAAELACRLSCRLLPLGRFVAPFLEDRAVFAQPRRSSSSAPAVATASAASSLTSAPIGRYTTRA